MTTPAHNSPDEFVSYLDHLWTSIKSRPGAILINSTDSLAPLAALQGFQTDLSPPPCLFSVGAAENQVASPYFPFLNLIQANLKKTRKSPTALLEKTDVYSYQKELFSGFFETGQPRRTEEVIREELLYEKSRIQESIQNLIVGSVRDGQIIFIGAIHLCPRSTFDLIRVLLERDSDQKIMLVMTYDRNYLFRHEESEKDWLAVFQYLEVKSYLLDFREDLAPVRPHPTTSHQALVLAENREPTADDVSRLLEAARTAHQFLAFHDSRAYAIRLHDAITKYNLKLPDADYISLIHTLGDACNYLEDGDNALIFYNSLLQKLQKDMNYGELSYLYHKMALINHYKDNHDIAIKLSTQSTKFADKYGTDYQKAMAYFSQLIVESDILSMHEHFKTKYNRIFSIVSELLKKNGLRNHLAYLLSLATYILSLLQYGYKDEAFANCEAGIQIAEADNNLLRLATANHIMGMLHQELGAWDLALASYKKSQNLRLALEDYIELARSCNGIGYFYFTIENYALAHDSYLQALDYLQKSEDKDYIEICATLYNISIIYYYSFKYEAAIAMLEKLIAIMYALKIENLPYVPSFDIWSVLGIAYLLSGNRIKAFEYIKKIATHPKVVNQEYESEYFEYFKGLFYYNPDDFERSNIQLQKAIDVVSRSKRTLDYLLMHIYYTYGSILQTQGNQTAVKDIVRIGLEYAANLNFNYHKGLLKSLLNRLENPTQQFSFPPSNFNHKPILQELRHLQDMNRLHKRMEEINFLYTVQNTLSKSVDTKELIDTICRLVETEFSSEIVAVATIDEVGSRRSIQLAFSDHPPRETIDTCRRLVEQLVPLQDDRLIPVVRDSEFRSFAEQFSSLVYIPIRINGTREMAILCCATRDDFSFTISDHRILSIAAKQMWTTVERINLDRIIREKNQELEVANLKLKKAAITDGLTELYNKDELFKRLTEEMKRSQRYYRKDSQAFSVVFIDLDNFKYYNDSFGHGVGDVILRLFADIIKQNIRDVDFGFRYGGDEFVVLLSHTEVAGAVHVVERLYSDLRAQDNFLAVIKERTGQVPVIPADKCLGCSIGIAHFMVTDKKSVDEILNQADMALYAAKRAGKNQYKIFDPSFLGTTK